MDAKECRRWSKFLSFVLRHDPASVGLDLDTSGWADVRELLAACSRNGRTLTRDQLGEVVRTNNKQRFAFNDE
jgi:putative RNA 2'-phosphotransferase